MAAYAQISDFKTPGKGLPERALGNILPSDIMAALEDASRLADNFLSVRYKLPLLQFGSDLTTFVCQIAAYNLMIGRGFNPTPGSSDEQLEIRFKFAIDMLKRISEGKANLVGVTDSSEPDGVVDDLGLLEIASEPPRGWR